MTTRRTYKENAEFQIRTAAADGIYTFPSFYFYLGDIEQGIKNAYHKSIHSEEWAKQLYLEVDRLSTLFEAALYRDLARAHNEARALWELLVERRRKIPDADILKWRHAYLLIYEGYALAKLERWEEIAAPVKLGFDGLKRGRGYTKSPHRHSREYGLVDVLLTLSRHMLNPDETTQPAIQKALEVYKRENVRYGRNGYEVIFDLQFSYPDLLTPVLPGDDPAKD